MRTISVLDKVLKPGIVSVACPDGNFQHELVSPRSDKSCVLDLAPPLYDPRNRAKIYDRSPFGNHGTITGAIWTRLFTGHWALDLDGSDDFLTVSRHTSIEPANITLFIWVHIKSSAPSAIGSIFDKPFTSHADPYRSYTLNILDANTGTPDLDAAFVVGGVYTIADSVQIADISAILDTWVLAVSTFNETTMCLDINGGKTIASKDNVGSLDYYDTDLYIGKAGATANRCAFIRLALPRIHSRVLSASEKQNQFNEKKHLFGV